MIGITSYGAYIPRLRLSRSAIVQNIGWLAPAVMMVAQGERSMCNWDEDSITMAVAAAKDCLKDMDKDSLDAVYLASTTLPFADRQNAGIVSTALNLKDNILTSDFTSSQKAATSALVTALDVVKGENKKNILIVSADKRNAKAASLYEMWFGDGAASLMVGNEDVIAEFLGSYSVAYDFVPHYRGAEKRYDYVWEERWVRDEGYSKIIPEAVFGLMDKLDITVDDVDKLVFPCFFKAEHRKIAQKIGVSQNKLVDNMHEVCGETGTAHSFLMLVAALEEAKPGDGILIAGFGQGCDALYFRVTENIKNLSLRQGFKGSLANKQTTDNYMKWLVFRDLIQKEMGIRAEAPTQTAMTALWRNRKMILGLVGGRCNKCNTPQFPKTKVCVNPDCSAISTQEDYEYSDISAKIKTFTGDMLAVSINPPHKYGLIQFEGGGRFMADFTDCDLDDLKIGMPVKMSFRMRTPSYDSEHGFTNYFWKAIPVHGERPDSEKVRFDDKVAIITGAGGGLGKVYALELAKRGAKIVVNDLGSASDGSGDGVSSFADEVVSMIKDMGGDAVANYDNVAIVEGGENIVSCAMESFGRIDIVINNAGILRDKSFLKQDAESWNKVLAVHLTGAYNVTKPAFKFMKENKYGRIIMTTSAAGLYGNFGQTNYSAAKMGLVGFMNTLKLEGERYNIKVNTVAPLAASRLTKDIMPSDLFEKMKPEYVAPLVLYLSSEECKETGFVFNAGMGYVNRAAVMTGPAFQLGDVQNPPTVEEIYENWDKINNLKNAEEFTNTTAAILGLLTPPDPDKIDDSQEQDKTDLTVADIFNMMPDGFNKDASKGVNVVFQYNISGLDAGDWFVEIKDGSCNIEKGRADKPTCTLKMSDEDFVGIITGSVNSMQAYTSGKLKIEGDIMKSQLIEKLFTLK